MTRRIPLTPSLFLFLSLALGCGGVAPMDGSVPSDSGVADGAIVLDGAPIDAADIDGGGTDSGVMPDAAVPVADPTRALFVGNSYTFYNDLPVLYRAIVESLPADVFTDSSTAGGRRLVEHAGDAQMVGHVLHTAVNTDVSWTHVVLQEQSQIPGFLDGNSEFDASRVAATELATLADGTGATVVFFMTWGRRTGDSRNMALFPDYATMQDRLETGYRSLATAARDAGATVVIAPVGLAFREVHDSEVDPLAADALFTSLYASDGSHPSLAGSYLAACVFVGTMLAIDPTTITHVPDGLDPSVATQLRVAAEAAVIAERTRP